MDSPLRPLAENTKRKFVSYDLHKFLIITVLFILEEKIPSPPLMYFLFDIFPNLSQPATTTFTLPWMKQEQYEEEKINKKFKKFKKYVFRHISYSTKAQARSSSGFRINLKKI